MSPAAGISTFSGKPNGWLAPTRNPPRHLQRRFAWGIAPACLVQLPSRRAHRKATGTVFNCNFTIPHPGGNVKPFLRPKIPPEKFMDILCGTIYPKAGGIITAPCQICCAPVQAFACTGAQPVSIKHAGDSHARSPERIAGWSGQRRTCRRKPHSSGTSGQRPSGQHSPGWPAALPPDRSRSPSG